METYQSDARPKVLAGKWYPGTPGELKATIDQYMRPVKAAQGLGVVVGLISPHAGYQYSGPVAAYAYKQIAGKTYDSIVVVAPNHAEPYFNFSSVFTHGSYETPLGRIPVDKDLASAIAGYDPEDNVKAADNGHLGGEHAVEIQLPFLQTAVGKFSLVPIVMGDDSPESCEALGKAISSAVKAAKGKKILLVASSDMSHFFDSATARQLDNRVKKYIEAFDPKGLIENREVNRSRVCGRAPIAAIMTACRQLGATKATVLHMANSGDVTDDTRSVVGYLAAALTIPSKSGDTKVTASAETKVGVDLGLTEKEKDTLRNVVKKTLTTVVDGGRTQIYTNYEGKLGEKWGAFVTLYKKGNLRGCIGYIVGTQALIQTVADMTKAAALDDPRFNRVDASELPDITFEISVLTPIRILSDINDIVIGRDGLIITRGYNHGLLLPQVASEYGWDRTTFLEQTCRKASLPTDAWKDKNTKIEVFSAEVFH
ncbi:MAG: AmmeMemoRadiSam system protein B [Candidatus Latescibacterota bacterium]